MVVENNESSSYLICSFCKTEVSDDMERCPSCKSSLSKKGGAKLTNKPKNVIEKVLSKEKTTSNGEISIDILEQIEKLSNLKDKGVLTDNEFQLKKTELLNKPSVSNKPNVSNKIKCPTCGKEISSEAKSCPGCGHPFKTVSEKKNGYIVVMAGSLLTVIGLFLPWLQMGIISASAFQKTSDSTYLLASSAGVFLFALIGFVQKKNLGVVIIVFTLLNAALLYFIYNIFTEHISEIGSNALLGRAVLGNGFWVSVVGVIAAFIGATLLAENKKKS